MKRFLPLLLLLGLVACTFKPPIFITTRASNGLESVRRAQFQVGDIQRVELHDFKRAFIKKYGDEAAFQKQFRSELETLLAADTAPTEPTFQLELQRLDVDSHTVSTSMMVGGGPHSPGHMQTTSTEYCVIKVDYRVKGPNGEILLEGHAQEVTAKGEFLHPNQSKLANAVSGVQKHLVNYFRGRMAKENIS